MTAAAPGTTPRSLARRLAPLMVAMALQGMILWVPVEKLFMSEIGFTPVSVGVMAAVYAAVVPLLEVPSGVLADRWSRTRIMVLACVALLASTTIGGLSHDVVTYIVSAAVLGAYFALSSGTVDSIVYDTVLEETGSSDLYETWIGRVRMVESAALVVSALSGGVLAELTSARTTYFATLPFAAVAIVAFLKFDEPRLHRAAEATSLRSHIALTVRTITRRRDVLRVLLLAALVAMLSQALFEFGPLWLVALGAPAVLYGPYWALLMSTLGLGGYLAAKLDLTRATVVGALVVVAPAAALVLALTRSLAGSSPRRPCWR
jgi:MFS family permease